jgi:predicted MFS family arabinose efflux permease
MVRAVGLVPVALILYAIAPNLPLSALAIVLVGALYLAALSSYTTIAQQRSPAAMRGRVLSLNAMLLGTVYPLAAAVQGALADRFGLREVTAGSAAIMLVVLLAVRALRPGYADAVDLPLTQASPAPAPLPAS